MQNTHNKRTEQFRNNSLLNDLLAQLKLSFAPLQKEKQQEFEESKWPVGFIVGNPRSGTTLLLQWLASLNLFSYPTNILTRFAFAPYYGALIQKLIFDERYDFHGDFSDIQSDINFESNLGKSKGALATNEFQHFFRNYMPNFDPSFLTEEQIQEVDFGGLSKALASIEHAFGKPFVTKAIMLQFNIEQTFEEIPNIFFLYIRRNPVYIMQSLFYARLKYFNDASEWWSVKPREYESLKKQDIYDQIAGQVFFTEKAIQEGLEIVPKQNKIVLNYEDFCSDPETFYQQIRQKYLHFGYELPEIYNGEKKFNINNSIKLSENELGKFSKSYNMYVNKYN